MAGGAEDEDHEGEGLLPPNPNPLFNQSDLVVTVETDAGITGSAKAEARKILIAPCAGRLIGQDPHYIERLWQDMSRASLSAGARKVHALGALDLALWDIKGKVLNLPGARGPGRNGPKLLRDATTPPA